MPCRVYTDEKCPKARVEGRMPAVNISYFDAQRAAANYSLYLQNAKEFFLKQIGVAAFYSIWLQTVSLNLPCVADL